MSRPRLAVVGDEAGDTAVETARLDRLTPAAAAEATAHDAVLTLGEHAFVRTARREPSLPLLPVVGATAPPTRGVGGDARRLDGLAADPETAVAAVSDGAVRAVDRVLLSVTVGDEAVGTAVLDAGLMTSEPARISEYRVTDDGRPVETVRSDGVVVSTPLGSGGYGRAAGGPVLAPETGLAVTPVAPFATAASPLVLPGPVGLRVERDEGDVSLLVDDERVRVVPAGRTVVCAPDATVRVLHPTRA